MGGLPGGTLTFVLTDIEGSTTRWDRQPEAMRQTMTRHDEIVSDSVRRHDGALVEAGREGDSVLAVFARASDAVAAAITLQATLSAEAWPAEAPIRVRVAVHTGEPELRESHYQGVTVSRCARILATTQPGEVLLSQATRNLVFDTLPFGVSLEDLGPRALKDLERPERVYRLRHPDLPSDFARSDAVLAYRNNLPIQLTSFVGRTAELQDILSLLEKSRLVTVTGAAGCGKTRLALEAAIALLPSYSDGLGVWLVELGQVSDPAFVGQAVATVLGVRDDSGVPIVDSLATYLKHQRSLLLIDSCEHLVEATARLAEELLRRCPELRLLVTSREALRVPGETTWRIPSLALPDEALALFLERARASNPTLELTEGERPTAELLCRRLDGIPLAIELAAARVTVMSVREILERLENRFRLLTGGSRTAVPRQQTLRAAVDWSYRLLDESERLLFRQLSVFSGGFALDSLEAVCCDERISAPEVVELLSQLVDKSLVVPQAGSGTRYRYHLLETLSEYGREELVESDEADVVWRRHALHFADLAERANDARRAEETANMTRALEFFRAGESELGLRMAVALAKLWDSSGKINEGRERLEGFLTAVPGDPELRAAALDGVGLLAFRQTDMASARSFYEGALKLRMESGESAKLSRTIGNLGMVNVLSGELQLAREQLAESLRIGRKVGDSGAVGNALMVLGMVAYFTGELEEAEAHGLEALRLTQDAGDQKLEGFLYAGLGVVAMERGRHAEAHTRFGTSLNMSLQIGDRLNVALLFEAQCCLAAAESDWAVSLRLGGAAAALREASGARPIPFWQDRVADASEKARAALDPESAAAAFDHGRSLDFSEAVRMARGVAATGAEQRDPAPPGGAKP
jgi:predicted ATPase/class 3 adenylate cyclase